MLNGEREKHDVHPLISLYDIGNILNIKRLTGGLTNNVRRVDTTTGAYVFKEYNNPNLEAIREEMKLLYFLNAQNFPVPHIVATRSGVNITNMSNRTGYLYTFTEGYNPQTPNMVTGIQVKEAGRTLGMYHSLMDGYTPAHNPASNFPFYNPSNFFSVESAVELWTKTLETIGYKNTEDEIDRQIRSVSTKKIQSLQKMDDKWLNSVVRSLPKIRGHGDYHGGNIVFGKDAKVQVVLDWELNRGLATAWEAQYAITLMCKKDNTENFNTPLDLEKVRDFMRGYRETNSLKDEEVAAMPLMARAISMVPYFLLRSHYFEGSNKLDIFLPKSYDHWFWWDDYVGEYYDAIR